MLKIILVDIANIKSRIKMRRNFSGRTLCLRKKLPEFLVSVTLKSFRNISHDRYRSSPQLVPQTIVAGESLGGSQVINGFCNFPRFLPGHDVFESPNPFHSFFPLSSIPSRNPRFGTSNFELGTRNAKLSAAPDAPPPPCRRCGSRWSPGRRESAGKVRLRESAPPAGLGDECVSPWPRPR